MRTIYRNDFENPNRVNFNVCETAIFEPRHIVDQELAVVKAPFTNLSVYRENHLRFQNHFPIGGFRPSQVPTIDRRLPFYSQVSNKDYGNYQKQEVDPLEDGRRFAKSQFQNPIATEVFLENVSTSKEAFQAYLNSDKVKTHWPVEELGTCKLPAFKNQFKNSSSDYSGFQNKVCPAQRALKNVHR